jgi:hypothetical protein
MTALIFFGGIALLAGAFFMGKKVQKDADTPVLIIREDQVGHSKEFPHHIHPHDQV